jgi:hypothetical protein
MRIYLIILICMLILVTLTSMACDFSVDIKVENKMPIDITIVYTQYKQDSTIYFSRTSDVIPSGQTGIVKSGIINGISVIPKIVFQAKDSSDNVVWQKSWTGTEFGKMAESGHLNIVVSPGTTTPQ